MKKNRIRLTESQLHKVIKESVKRVLNEDVSVIDDVYKRLYRVHDEIRDIQHQLQREAPEAYQALEHLEAEVLKTAQVIGTMR